jgi:hypothetical protein
MRVMNYNNHPNKVVDDWRMKVWNKSLKLKSSWPALNCKTIGEIRQVSQLLLSFSKIIHWVMLEFVYRYERFNTIM